MTGPSVRAPRPLEVAGAAAVALLLLTWVSSGSIVLALLVVVLVAGVLGLGALLLSWAAREPAGDLADRVPDAMPTTDLHHEPTPGARVRAALRGLLARPWVRGDGLVRAASARLASPDALVWTPRGQQVAAPHLWVEWNADDLAELAARWPLEVLARELADGYGERVREQDVRRMAERTVLHLLAGTDVPRGRVMVTAAFSGPQRTPVATASTPDDVPAPTPGPRAMAPRVMAPRANGPRAVTPARPPRPVATVRTLSTRLLSRAGRQGGGRTDGNRPGPDRSAVS